MIIKCQDHEKLLETNDLYAYLCYKLEVKWREMDKARTQLQSQFTPENGKYYIDDGRVKIRFVLQPN